MIDLDSCDPKLSHDVHRSSRTDLAACLQCKSCGNGCPFVGAMDFTPNQIIRLVQLGMAPQALESATIWICVGCNTCAVNCPMAIDIPAVMDALRHLALESGVTIAEPDILRFHREVLHSVKRYGRTHKLEIMMRYKLRTLDLFSDLGMGLNMLKKRKLDLTPSKINDIHHLDPVFKG